VVWLNDPKRRYLPVLTSKPDLMEAMVKVRKPIFFIVRNENAVDEKKKQLIEKFLATKLDGDMLVHTIGTWNAYNLAGLINKAPTEVDNTLLRVTDFTGGLFYPDDANEIHIQ
jgi:hypothetical protein